MFFHLKQLVDHGTIDNRTPGRVELRLWLKDEEFPMVFDLSGDCLRDIAGCLLEFKLSHQEDENAEPPENLPPRSPDAPSIPGIVGDMTASRRIRTGKKKSVFNSLYLEWFSEEYEAFLLETHLFEIISVSAPSWSMAAYDEQSQLMTNQQILSDFVQDWIKGYSLHSTEQNPLPDHPWDIRLREAEGTAIIYQEIHKKYGSHPFGEIAEAFIMGWDSRLGKMADSDENGTAFSCRIRGMLNIFDILTEEEAIETQLCMSHPLFQKVLALTEHLHSTFSGYFTGKSNPASQLPPGILRLFEMVRYITPNILSCLLQSNGEDANYSLLTERMDRCSNAVDKSLSDIEELKFNRSKIEEMLVDIHSDTISMQRDFAKQVKH